MMIGLNKTWDLMLRQCSSTRPSTRVNQCDGRKSVNFKTLQHCVHDSMHSKSVNFCVSTSQTYYVDNIDELLAEHVWYSQSELRSIKSSNAKVFKYFSKGKIDEGAKYTLRGLEDIDVKEKLRRFRIKNKALNAVMEEQERQYQNGVYDPTSLADVYRNNGALISQELAYGKGLKDFEDSR